MLLFKSIFLLLLLLINSGCTTCMLLNKAKPTGKETYYETINQVTSAYWTPDQELIICLRGIYEGKPPEQEYAFRVTAEQLKPQLKPERQWLGPDGVPPPPSKSRVVSIPRNQMISACPDTNDLPKTWKQISIKILPLYDYSQIDSLQPVVGTNETIYEWERRGTDNKEIIYARNNLTNPIITFQTDKAVTKQVVEIGGDPLLYLLLPIAVGADIITTPVILMACYGLGVKGCVSMLTTCN